MVNYLRSFILFSLLLCIVSPSTAFSQQPDFVEISGPDFTIKDQSGNILGQGTVSTTNSPYWPDNNYSISGYAIGNVDDDLDLEVVLIAKHSPNYPSQVYAVEKDGAEISRYWNPGHLHEILLDDINGDGKSEILVAGTNNDQVVNINVPVVFALDAVTMNGEAPPRQGSLGSGTELWYTVTDNGLNASISYLTSIDSHIICNTSADQSGSQYILIEENGNIAQNLSIEELFYSQSKILLKIQTAATIDLNGAAGIFTADSLVAMDLIYWDTSFLSFNDDGTPFPDSLDFRTVITSSGNFYYGTITNNVANALAVFDGYGLSSLRDFSDNFNQNDIIIQPETNHDLRMNRFGWKVGADYREIYNAGFATSGPQSYLDVLETDFSLRNGFDKNVVFIKSMIDHQHRDYSWYNWNQWPFDSLAMQYWSPSNTLDNEVNEIHLDRSFKVELFGFEYSFLNAQAYTDNGDNSQIYVNGDLKVSNTNCCGVWYREANIQIDSVSIYTESDWSRAHPKFSYSVVADSVKTTENKEWMNNTLNPADSYDQNPEPFKLVLAPGWNYLNEEEQSLVTLSVPHSLQIRPDSTISVPVEVDIPAGMSIDSIEFSLSNYQSGLEYINIDTSNTLIGNRNWNISASASDSIFISAKLGSENISDPGILCFVNFLAEDIPCQDVPISVNNGLINSGTDSLLTQGGSVYITPHPPAYGDVDFNGQIQAYDASLILKHMTGADTLVCQDSVNADVTANGFLSSLDASVLLQYGVGLIDELPADINSTNEQLPGPVLQTVSEVGGVFRIPLNISQSDSNIFSFEGQIIYDAAALEFEATNWTEANGWIMKSELVKPGLIKVAGASGGAGFIQNNIGSLKFRISENYTGDSTEVKIDRWRWNEKPKIADVDKIVLSQTILNINPAENLPQAFQLKDNFPNPFNPKTTIAYGLPSERSVRIEVINIRGKLVATLIDKSQDAGWYSIQWNGCDNNGVRVSSGVYFYRLKTEGFESINKMLLVK